MGDHGYTAVLSQEGSVVLERGPISGATEGPGRDLGRCAKLWRLVFVCLLPGALPAGNSGKVREGVVVVEPCLRKEADTKSRRLDFVYLVVGHFSLPQLGVQSCFGL